MGTAVKQDVIDLAAIIAPAIEVYDFETGLKVTADSKTIAFAKGTDVAGEPIMSGPLSVKGMSYVDNEAAAPLQQVSTLTVSVVPTVNPATGLLPASVTFNVTYHDNLSIIPNQMKQTIVSVVPDAANTASTTTWAAAIAAAFNAQEFLYVGVSPAAAVITFTGIQLVSATKYNHIDRPEFVVFEIGVPNAAVSNGQDFHGTYAVAVTTAPDLGSGNLAQVQWMEEQHMGRQGFADRRMWNDTKKYPTQVGDLSDDPSNILVIQTDNWLEGDMQGLRANPVGVIIVADETSTANIADVIELAKNGTVLPVSVLSDPTPDPEGDTDPE